MGDWNYISDRLHQRKEKDYHNYQWETEWEDGNGYRLIHEKGFGTSTKILEDQNKYIRQKVALNESSMGKQSEKYFRKIIEYCLRRNISITLFVSPINDLELISTQDYDAYIRELRELAAEYDLAVYDFNLAREEYLPLQDSRYYMDAGHLNAAGVSLFTPFFYEVIRGGEADAQKYFYDSYREKLRELPPAIYGIYYSDCQDEEEIEQGAVRKMWIASNRELEMEYKIMMKPDEGAQYMIQDFGENKAFEVSSEEHGMCTIVARMKGTRNEVVQTMEIRY